VEAQRLLGRQRSELEFVQPGVLRRHSYALASLQTTCSDVGEALALQYFHVTRGGLVGRGHRAKVLARNGEPDVRLR